MKILIDAVELIKCVEGWLPTAKGNERTPEDYIKEDIVTSLLMEIEEQPVANDWIPCSERVPENKDNVLVSTEHNDVMISHYQPNLHEWDGEEWEDEVYDKVIAWKPLPKPYKENKTQVEEWLPNYDEMPSDADLFEEL